MNFNSPYNREEYVKFFRDQFLPEDFEQAVESIRLEFDPQYTRQVTKIGHSTSLDLNVYEVKHGSENDPRVSLSKESFRLLADFGQKRALVLFVSDKPNYRLSLVTIDLKWEEGKRPTKEYSNPRRYSFFLGPDAKTHTPEYYLIEKGRIKDFDDLNKRFSIEIVNKDFYTEIAKLFTKLTGGKRKIGSKSFEIKTGSLIFPSPDDTKRKEFAVRLIGRLVFCWFLKKKHSEKGVPLLPEELLCSQAVERYQGLGGYYHGILEPLFFKVLNTPMSNRAKQFQSEPWMLIPFLNGGLFTKHEDDYYKLTFNGVSEHLNDLIVPDDWLKDLLTVFETYNFTIDENTPVDIELAIEPEMLGRIFENLLAEINPETGETARKKATGSYYTPRPIVEYMVDESLKQYLLTKTSLSEDEISTLLSYAAEDSDLTDAQKDEVLDALDAIKVIDPACGSGAFPMGILQKILLILQKIDPDSQKWLSRILAKIENVAVRKELESKLKGVGLNYIHKLGIIQGSIYGVDIQPIAVDISKLRCFLSLIVDETIDDAKPNRSIEPLPNLEFKFVCANALIGLPEKEITTASKKDTKGQSLMFEASSQIKELKELREKYLRSYGKEKKQIETRFREVQRKMFEHALDWRHIENRETQTLKLSQWNPFSDEPCPWFDPEWMFGIKDGFDIIIANPPYITIALGKKQKFFDKNEVDILKEKYKDVFEYKGNTYTLFIKLSFSILAPHKFCAFIIPNTLLLNSTCTKIRRFLLLNTSICNLVNVKDKVFKDAEIGGNLIFIFSKEKNLSKNNIKLCEVGELERFNDRLEYDYVPQKIYLANEGNKFYMDINDLKLMNKIHKQSIRLNELTNFYNGIKTGNNKKFLADKKIDERYRKVIRGRDVQKYKITFSNKYVLFDKELLWSNTNEEYLTKIPKIVMRQTGDRLIGALDNTGYLTMDTTHLIFETQVNIRFLLALLNSQLMNWFHQAMTAEEGRAFAEVKIVNLKKLPIKETSIEEQAPFVTIVEKILAITESDDYAESTTLQTQVKEYESQIDQMVYKLYGLTAEEIAIIEGKSKTS